MKATRARRLLLTAIVAPAAILALTFAAAGPAASADDIAIPRRSLHGKVEYCTDCHGLSAQGYLGFLPIPRLAGQPMEYIENQLRAFVESRRDRGIFLNMARIHGGLRPDTRSGLAAHFRDLNPRPLQRGPRDLMAMGRRIYDDGVPEANVPACAACHGPGATGRDAIPRLAGQLYSYTITQLTHWSSARNQYSTQSDPAVVMTPIAHNLTPSQIRAIAAYVSNLE